MLTYGLTFVRSGTTEIDFNDLSGANFIGNKKGWCHSTSMHHPPQVRFSRPVSLFKCLISCSVRITIAMRR
jgi:hypothetical protein